MTQEGDREMRLTQDLQSLAQTFKFIFIEMGSLGRCAGKGVIGSTLTCKEITQGVVDYDDTRIRTVKRIAAEPEPHQPVRHSIE